MLRIIGVDPGLKNLGLASLVLQGDLLILESVKLIQTKKADKKLNLRQKGDDARRLEELHEQLREWLAGLAPFHVAGFEECPSPPNSKTARQVALAWGTTFSLIKEHSNPLTLDYGPKELKRILTGSAKASKKDMIAAVDGRYTVDYNCRASDKEHIADAIAAAIIASQDPTVQQIQVLARG